MRIGVYTSVCEEDARWIDQYLAEIQRLDLSFAIHFDRCSDETKRRLSSSSYCVGTTSQDDPKVEFTEQWKQGAFDIIVKEGFDWALAWDVDETWEKDAKEKMLQLPEADYIDCKWVNLWNDPGTIRVDGPFAGGHRVKFYSLRKDHGWKFTHPITNGAKHTRGPEPVEARYHELVCLHWGLMTREDRLLHKMRWDRIYGKAVGKNPYGIWNYALNESAYPPVLSENHYL